MKGSGTTRTQRPKSSTLQSHRRKMLLLPENSSPWELHSVKVQYFDPLAHEVCMAGTFNDWRPEATPMRRDTKGNWTVELLLSPGAYEYRLLVDGQWKDDPMAKRFVANAFGGLNCILEVKPFIANVPTTPRTSESAAAR